MMLDRPGMGVQVRGALYAIDQSILARLDALQSVGQPGNFRRTVKLEPVGAGTICRASCYMKAPELAWPVHSGYLEDDQDRRFLPPERRGPPRFGP